MLTEDLEERLSPLRDAHRYDRRMAHVRDLPGPLFTHTDDLPVDGWPAHRDRLPEPLPLPPDLEKDDHDGAMAWLRENADRFNAAFDVVLMLAFLEHIPVLSSHAGTTWMALEHKVAGTMCGIVRLVGVRLTPRPEARAAFKAIARHWYGSDLCSGRPLLSQLREYQDAVQRVGVDCNRSWWHLCEGIYPVDHSQEALAMLAVDPPDLDSLFGDPRPYGGAERLARLVWLAPNSD